MANKLLVNRLNKRVTIRRLPNSEEYLSDSVSESTIDGGKAYAPDKPANVLFNDLFDPNAPLRDEYGQPIEVPVEVAKVWASIEPLRGNDRYVAMSEYPEVTTRIRIRYREGIDRTMVVKYKETEFEILYIIHPEFGNKELQLMCKERQ